MKGGGSAWKAHPDAVDAAHSGRLDLYELLEISPRASQEVIQAAYRVLVRHHHPDVSAGLASELRIRQINAAYEVLSDPEHRARYDLECVRAARAERLRRAGRSAMNVSGAPLQHQTARAMPRPKAELGSTQLNPHAIVGLLATAIVVMLVVVVLWTSLDEGTASVPTNSSPRVDLVGR